MFIPHFYNAKSLPKRLAGFENGYENASLYIYIYIYIYVCVQASYLLKSENHRDSSFSFIQGVATSKKQRLYFLLLYHKRLVVKRFPMVLSLISE
ncbi:hypothetical protein SPPN_10900 [Streptococcus pseudopneumoniae IS7493]|nr:hypothetical protein SPPN_10900 [Streptococcus pseudopneumoniae IS7493]